jgi:hypothetical protein
MIIVIAGDSEHSQDANEALRNVISSLCHSANSSEHFLPWILSSAHESNHIGKQVGYAIKDINEECNTIKDEECNIPVICIGLGTWGFIRKSEELITRRQNGNLGSQNQN